MFEISQMLLLFPGGWILYQCPDFSFTITCDVDTFLWESNKLLYGLPSKMGHTPCVITLISYFLLLIYSLNCSTNTQVKSASVSLRWWTQVQDTEVKRLGFVVVREGNTWVWPCRSGMETSFFRCGWGQRLASTAEETSGLEQSRFDCRETEWGPVYT